MDITVWLVACIPIFSFGFIPVMATKIGGKPFEQSMGIACGSLLFAVVVFFITKPELNPDILLFGLLSGIFWAVGSIGQFMGIHYLGVSKSTPISNGGQIIATSLFGILLGDWATSVSRTYGVIALALIILGILFTSYREAGSGAEPQWKKGLLVNLISVLGFAFYVVVLKYQGISGWESLLPQAFGQILGIYLFSIVFFKASPFSKYTLKNGVTGILWAIGNIALLLSQVKISLAVAYPLSQAAVIVSILGGVYINKEAKTAKEWKYAILGMLIILSGLASIYFSGIHDNPA